MKIQTKSALFIILSGICYSSAHATNTSIAMTLKPSLQSQMQKQETINIKNNNASKLALARERARAARWASKNTSLILVSATPAVTSVAKAPQVSVAQSTTATPEVSSTPLSLPPSTPTPPNVDINRVRSTWMGWYNDVRNNLGLNPYSYDSRLEVTAYDWNQVFAAGKWLNHHTRKSWDGYYNFSVIDQWFKTRGINPPAKNGSKHVENVGYGYYRCSASDCTDELISAIRSTFNFYMSEKSYGGAHYRSIANPNFSKIGFNIIVVPGESRYYITTHYITE